MRHRFYCLTQRLARDAGQAVHVGQVLTEQQVDGARDRPGLAECPWPRGARLDVVAQLVDAQQRGQRRVVAQRRDDHLPGREPARFLPIPVRAQPPRHATVVTVIPVGCVSRDFAIFFRRWLLAIALAACFRDGIEAGSGQRLRTSEQRQQRVAGPAVRLDGVRAIPATRHRADRRNRQQLDRATVCIPQHRADAHHRDRAGLFVLRQQWLGMLRGLDGCLDLNLVRERTDRGLALCHRQLDVMRIAVRPGHHCAAGQP